MDFDRDANPTAEVACRRQTERYRLLYANEAFVEFAAPDRKPWRLEVLGISSDGLCFGLNDGQPKLEPGSKLNAVVVQIAGVTLDGSLTIAHTTEEFAAGTICGAKFKPTTQADVKKLKQAIAALGW